MATDVQQADADVETDVATEAVSLQSYVDRLEGLAEVISERGLRARLVTPLGRMPSLHVVNPAAAALAEDVYAGRCQDGQWWYWWSWAERIAVTDDLPGAARKIGQVLAARDDPHPASP
jgi:hypothetical protein